MEFVRRYLSDVKAIADRLDAAAIERLVAQMVDLRDRGGRLFCLGVGGGAGHASHAVNDFRKLAGIEAYSPSDNVSEITERINDEGWDTSYANWLKASRLGPRDGILVLSVGGGNVEKGVSINLVRAVELAKEVGARVWGIVGRDGGFTGQVADACVLVPSVNPQTVTPHTEAFQAVVWHLIVSHPRLRVSSAKWESLATS